MNKYTYVLLLLMPIIFMSGCAQKVKIKALNPAEIDRATSTKRIAVVTFKQDKVGLSSKIESNLSRFRIQNKSFFTMVSRSDINQVIKEQKLQNSGLIETGKIVEVGNLIGAQALISGSVGLPSMSDTYFYETRATCANKKCTELRYYKVRCTKRLISLSAEVKMVDIEQGDIIYSDSLSRSASYKHCRDDSRVLPSKSSVAQNLATQIANDFTYKLTPHYVYFEVELLEKEDLDFDDRQEQLLKSSLTYIKHNRLDKAERLLKELIDSTSQQSYVAFYNLGVVKEAQGDLQRAKSYYIQADNLTIEPVEVIDAAYMRIISTIDKHSQTSKQIKR
ncbi:MAG: CsgG/HfaB family protein [Sulfurimonas sp.]|nr:CsgG/HfaB family protein [Sulfurimonas sp.]